MHIYWGHKQCTVRLTGEFVSQDVGEGGGGIVIAVGGGERD
jgi:hypothetical protein